MKVAILIGVSEYDTQKQLLGCKNDVYIMENIIDYSSTFEDKLVISDNTTSTNVKQQVSEFIEKYRVSEENIDEIFFYFSGHGLYENEEFYYILSDFDYSKLNRTTYKNSEIDGLLKSLNPQLTVKVIDACESGVRYVKDINDAEVKKILEKSKANFNNCYFMFSSQFNEASYAKSLSYFTESFIRSIIEHESDAIRYRDIIDFITDDFSFKSIQQTPYYVIQATNTELFANINYQARYEIGNLVSEIVSNPKKEEKRNETLTLVEKIIADSQYYCENFDEVRSVFLNIKEKVEQVNLRGELSQLYDLSPVFKNESYYGLPNINTIAEVLEDSKDELFINIEYTNEEYDVPVNNYLSSFHRALGTKSEVRYKNEYREVIDYFEISEEEMPYTQVYIDCIPKYSNLSKYNCSLIFAFSKKNLYIFYSFNRYVEVTWQEYELGNVKWRTISNLLLKDEDSIISTINSIIEEFCSYILEDLTTQYQIDIPEEEKKEQEIVE